MTPVVSSPIFKGASRNCLSSFFIQKEPETRPNRGENLLVIPPEGLIIGQDQDGVHIFHLIAMTK